MTTDLWNETEAAFDAYGNAVPLEQVILRGRRRQTRARVIAGGAGVAGVLLVGGIAIGSGGTGGVAYAGWTPAIQPADPDVLASTALACQGAPEQPDDIDAVRLVDRRGDIAIGSFDDGTLCVVVENRLAGVIGNIADLPPSDTGAVTIDQVHRLELTDAPQIEISAVTDKVQDGVDTVTIRRADRVEVEAVVEDGAFLAWWPGTQRPVEVRAFEEGALRAIWTE